MLLPANPNALTRSPLDRAAHLRRDGQWLAGALAAPHATLIAGRALGFEGAVRADVGPVRVDLHAVLDGCLVPAQTLSCRALVLVITRDVDEVGLAEAPLCLGVGGHRLGHVCPDACFFTGQDLRALEVATIGNHFQLVLANGLTRLRRHRPEFTAVATDVDDVVSDDQVMLGVGGHLHVVANHPGATPAGGHRAGIGIGQRQLLVGLILQLALDRSKLLHLLLEFA